MTGLLQRLFPKRLSRWRIARVALIVFLPLSAASTTGLSPLKGASKTVTVASVPHLAKVLGIAPPVVPRKRKPNPPQPAPTTTTTTTVPPTTTTTTTVPPSRPPATVTVPLNHYDLSAVDVLSDGASNMSPGATVSRAATLANTGNAGFSTITVTASPSAQVPLVTSRSDGLQLTVSECPEAWTAIALSDGGWRYTCQGTSTTLLSAPVATLESPTPLDNLDALNAGGVDHLVFTLTFPLNAPMSMAGESVRLSWTFTATAAS